jgi:hypothetical protein
VRPPARTGSLAVVLSAIVIALGAAGATTSGGASASGKASPKRGVASARYLVSNPGRLAALGAAWSYDWSATAPARRSTVAWVPMVWGPGSVTPAVIASLRTARRTGRAADLLGFNEPDSASQSNITPGRAAALWPALERTGLRLGSPAPAVPTDGWLGRFMKLVRERHLRVDFIALHYYQDFTDDRAVSELRRQLVAIHDEFHKPIWITEIGAIDLRRWHEPMLRPPTETLAVSYIRKLFGMLDALPFVERYAWFTDDCWSDRACRFGSLFNSAGRLTPAGAAFRAAR